MAVAPASMADEIVVLDGDNEEESPPPSCSASTSTTQPQAKSVSHLKAQQPVPTHIPQSPFNSAKKDTHVLLAENQKMFAEFVDHCSAFTQDCPEVLTFLKTRHSKASPDYLSSVEFRNTLGRCLTRAQAHRSKTFVFINELCTVLKQHAAKKKIITTKVDPGPCTSASASLQSTSALLKCKDKTKTEMNLAAQNQQLSMSGPQEVREDVNGEQDAEKKKNKASRKQIAYLENLLKMYNDEIHRLQKSELSLDDLDLEDSAFIHEHKLKRKMMKIYRKLCELKDCGTLTGRVIEQRIKFSSTRYPEINKRIQRFINKPEIQMNPPDYQDILQQMIRANEHYNLCLSRKQLSQMATEAFRDIGTSIQDRRHLDLVYNFGSHLTDSYKPAGDPALLNPSLLRKLRSNREIAVSRLEEVISKYAVEQEDTEELERQRRLEKNNKERGVEENKEVNGVEEDDDDEDDEEDESSDPDIEEEIQASTQQDGPDDEDEEGDDNDDEEKCDGTDKDDQSDKVSGSVSVGEEESVKDEDEDPITSGVSPLSNESKSQMSPMSDILSLRDSPSQSEPAETGAQKPLSNGNLTELEEPVDSSNHVSVMLVSTNKVAPVADSKTSLPLSPVVVIEKGDLQMSSGTSPPPSPRITRSHKRKREDITPETPQNTKNLITNDSEVDIPLDMGVFCCSSPQQTETAQASTPAVEVVGSLQLTPPPKKNKVNVATQCDPEEVIVLSDSE